MPVRLNEKILNGIVGDAFLLTSGHERIWSFIAGELGIPLYGGREMAGETLRKVWDSGVYAACCVVNEKAVPMFGERLFAVRVSGNSFVGGEVRQQVGEVGPDTTLRLFHLL